MKYLLLFILLFLCNSCATQSELTEGRWNGHLSPMNHPEMFIPVNYDVAYMESGLAITIIGSNGVPANAEHIYVTEDVLLFTFNEPEEQVALDCFLSKTENNGFSGRCTDSSGKWAQFTMIPPG